MEAVNDQAKEQGHSGAYLSLFQYIKQVQQYTRKSTNRKSFAILHSQLKLPDEMSFHFVAGIPARMCRGALFRAFKMSISANCNEDGWHKRLYTILGKFVWGRMTPLTLSSPCEVTSSFDEV